MIEQLRNIPHEKIEFVGTIILLSWMVLMVVLERLFPFTKGVKIFRKGFWTDFVWYTLIQSYALKILIFDYIIIPIKIHFLPDGVAWFNNQSMLYLILFFLFTHDFYIYVFHRMQHGNKWLWRTHEAHHSIRECDWLAGSRSHFLEILINQTIEFLPIFLLLDYKVALIIVPIKALLDALFGLWIHSNTKIDIGVFKYFINSPQLHKWHHSNHDEVFYANYATKFSVFDFLFKTSFLPARKGKTPTLYGLPYRYPHDFFLQSIYSLFRFKQDDEVVKSYSDFSARIRVKLMDMFVPKGLRNFIHDQLFDLNNAKYAEMSCSHCSSTLNVYCKDTTVYFKCPVCGTQTTVEHEGK